MRNVVLRLMILTLALCLMLGASIVIAGYLFAMPGLSSWHIGGQMSMNTACLLMVVGVAFLLVALLHDPWASWEDSDG
jgi:ABC-type dipeptide/oligopeptide/nickel transport system permease component